MWYGVIPLLTQQLFLGTSPYMAVYHSCLYRSNHGNSHDNMHNIYEGELAVQEHQVSHCTDLITKFWLLALPKLKGKTWRFYHMGGAHVYLGRQRWVEWLNDKEPTNVLDVLVYVHLLCTQLADLWSWLATQLMGDIPQSQYLCGKYSNEWAILLSCWCGYLGYNCT